MFIAHIPSGYILADLLDKKLKPNPLSRKAFYSTIMLGAIFPDIDLFYFYFFDQRSVHHHQYFLHWFSVWIPLFLLAFAAWKIFKQHTKFAFIAMLFSGAALLHICLDTFVGDVWLFAPFINRSYVFFEVTARYQPWWLNFIFHWSFLVELVICSYALILYIRKNKALK